VKVEILRQKENKVLKRKEVDFRIEHMGGTTPSRADVRAKIAAQLGSDPSTVVIRTLTTKFGIGMTEGSARIYTSPEQTKRVEIGYILERHEPKKKKGEEGAEGAPAEEVGKKAPAKAEKKKPEKAEKKEVEAEEEVAEELGEEVPEETEAAPPEKKRPDKAKREPAAEEKATEKPPEKEGAAEKKKEAPPAEKKEAGPGKKKGKADKEES